MARCPNTTKYEPNKPHYVEYEIEGINPTRNIRRQIVRMKRCAICGSYVETETCIRTVKG